MEQTMPDRPAPRRRWPWIALAVAVVAVAAVGASIGWRVGGDDEWVYDEAAHRNVVEAMQGPVKDWPAYRDSWLRVCADSDDLAVVAAVFIDSGDSPASVELNIQYTCPGRVGEIPQEWRTLD